LKNYRNYLESNHWKRIKNKKYNSNPKLYKCSICGYRKGLHLHHKTYKRIEKERLSDLVWLCEICHKNLHAEFDKSGAKDLFKFSNKFIKRERKRIKALF